MVSYGLVIKLQYSLRKSISRRKQLLSDGGFNFTQRLVDVEEIYPEDLSNNHVAEYLAVLKSKAYKLSKDEVLITADSIVLIDDTILGKPKDRDQGIEYLTKLSGNLHTVDSGVAIRSRTTIQSFKVSTEVEIDSLSESEIIYYLDTYQPYDKAGGYGIQDWMGICKVKNIKGSYTNVMGLPMARLYVELKKFLADLS